MKNLFIAMTVLLTVGAANAQLQQNEVRPESGQTEYIVNAASGPVILPATDGIQLLPGVHIQNGSDLRAYINDSPYEGPVLPGGPNGENYIYTRSYQKGMPDDSGIDSNYDVIEGITYFDGLGRPMQQIAIKASPDLKDIVTHMEYDNYGRMERGYLPYEETDPLEELGSLRPDAKVDTDTYYTNNYGPDLDTNAPNPYSQKLFEASPLNRVLKQAAPGEDWKIDNGHEIRFEYLTNTTNEVRRYGVDLTPDYVPTLAAEGFYTANELTKTVTKDENWTSGENRTTEEFTDKQGQVVLKRTYNGNDTYDTYYVYDDFGNLTYVIPPKVDTSDGVGAAELNGLCFQYRYDHRNRLIEKKIPGKGSATDWESIVYNTLDQPIMTQDPNLKAQGKWLYTKYDAFGRVAYTGMLNSTNDRPTHQANADSYGADSNNRQWVVPGSTTINFTVILYTDDGYPNSGYDVLHTINYYDGYDTARDGFAVPNGPVMGQAVSSTVQGLPTVSKVKVLSRGDWITTLTAYDAKGRPIYTRTENTYLNTADITENKLDHTGKLLDTKTVHTKGANTPITVEDSFEYDHMARLTGQSQRVNGQGEHLFTNTYDGIGQLVKKEVGNTAASPLQEVDYGYNIRGWLKNINDVNNIGNDLFSFSIYYNNGGSQYEQDLYNGNIKGTEWRTANDVLNAKNKKLYSYRYDPLNRLTLAFSDTGLHDFGTSYMEKVTYDKNGNILSMDRTGWDHYKRSDDLIYTYADNSNKLLGVSDDPSIGYDEGFLDGNTVGDDYAYDANGNMISDANKGIASITYNHLNLPVTLTWTGSNAATIDYVYDANGTKLRKLVSDGIVDTQGTSYSGNYVYHGTEASSLQFFGQPEGYVAPANENDYSQGFDYIYQYKDHLGNVRLSYTDANGDGDIDVTADPMTTEVMEENNYYPFGLKHKGYNNNISSLGNAVAKKYMFGGKEYQDELNLGWYDVSARNYDPALGRWMNLDPLAEQMRRHSPYNFGFNNPVYFQDYDGMMPQGPCGDKPCPKIPKAPRVDVESSMNNIAGVSFLIALIDGPEAGPADGAGLMAFVAGATLVTGIDTALETSNILIDAVNNMSGAEEASSSSEEASSSSSEEASSRSETEAQESSISTTEDGKQLSTDNELEAALEQAADIEIAQDTKKKIKKGKKQSAINSVKKSQQRAKKALKDIDINNLPEY